MPIEDFQDELIQDVLVAAGALGDLWQGRKENNSVSNKGRQQGEKPLRLRGKKASQPLAQG